MSKEEINKHLQELDERVERDREQSTGERNKYDE